MMVMVMVMMMMMMRQLVTTKLKTAVNQHKGSGQ